MTVASLFGMKPAMEVYRQAADAPLGRQVWSNDFTLLFTRMLLLVFNASPQALIQVPRQCLTLATRRSPLTSP
jgi:hypothetical protein